MIGLGPKFYTPCFKEIGQPIPEEKVFEGLPYMSVADILVMWPALFWQNFISLFLKAFIQNLIQTGLGVSEKSQF